MPPSYIYRMIWRPFSHHFIVWNAPPAPAYIAAVGHQDGDTLYIRAGDGKTVDVSPVLKLGQFEDVEATIATGSYCPTLTS
jgi:hypothetical protein